LILKNSVVNENVIYIKAVVLE